MSVFGDIAVIILQFMFSIGQLIFAILIDN